MSSYVFNPYFSIENFPPEYGLTYNVVCRVV
ncbi:hypothetical protein BN8_04717 [Fibrisoma limi BUZ 3]|uniref:Uncharacterized protein n=1 Tax=Fibrisoma limi BUZ 3 TaxID=1185876 RepID=I2GNI0_9BACT|nr:hypothetical protein BN8_04717 [Fibrisoma limi BUZ 3]